MGIGILSTSEVATEAGGGIPNGIAGIGRLGGGIPDGILGTRDSKEGIGTGRDGIVGIVGIVGIMTYIAVASDEGGKGPTASVFNSPDASLM